jgi:hypothetical protein
MQQHAKGSRLATVTANLYPHPATPSECADTFATPPAHASHVDADAALVARGARPSPPASAVDAAVVKLFLLHDLAAAHVFDHQINLRVGQGLHGRLDLLLVEATEIDGQLRSCSSLEVHCVSPCFDDEGELSRLRGTHVCGCSARSALAPSRARVVWPPRGRRMAQVTWAPYDGARVPCDRHARLPALHRWRLSARAALPGSGRTSFHFAPIQAGTCAAFHPVHVQPSKAAPILQWARAVVRDDPARCLRDSDPGATPCSANRTPPEAPSVSKATDAYARTAKSQNRRPAFARSFNTGRGRVQAGTNVQTRAL